MISRRLQNQLRRCYSTATTPPLLQGVKVVDLTRVLAGPFCTQILADYGADVIKIEHPSGDDTRHWRSKSELSFWKKSSENVSLYFSAVNRNKRSIVLDLKSKDGKKTLLDLVKDADVLVDNFIPGKMEELGFGYESLKHLNPRLIHASVSGYGTTGPYAKRAGYDLIAAAEGGLLHITGHPSSPVKPGLGLVDMCTGLYTHGAILAALQSRHATGKGCKIDTSLFETQISLMSNVATTWLNMGVEAQRWGNGHPSIVPYDAFQTSDSWLVLGAVNDAQFKKLCKLLNCENLLEDERYKKNEDRVAHRDELMPVIQEIFQKKSNEQWLAILEGSGMPYGPINTVQGAFEHPQIDAREMVGEVGDEDAVDGSVKMPGMPVKVGGYAQQMRRAPKLGEHTKEVLAELENKIK